MADHVEPADRLEPAERVERESLVPAAPAQVWEVVTGDGWLAEEVNLELVPGGQASFRDSGQVRRGWVEDVEAARRLVFWWDSPPGSDSRVELTLTPEDTATRVRIVETRPLELLDLVGIPQPETGGSQPGPVLLAAA